MNKVVTPVFQDDEEDIFNQKVMKLVEDRFTAEKNKTVQDKLDTIRKTIENKPAHEHKAEVDCPTCKGHTLQVNQDVAKCIGPNCGKEYLLVEKPKASVKKKYLCTTCGHTISKEEIDSVKTKDTCPLCNRGKSFVDINWGEIDNLMKNRDGLKRV